MVCVRCKKRTAVVFIQRMDNGKPVQEGYCLTCARATAPPILPQPIKPYFMVIPLIYYKIVTW